MRHHDVIISPEGTPTADQTVGELVAQRPGRSRIFQAVQIDFCCQGGRTLREACEQKHLSLDSILEQLEAEAGAKPPAQKNPAGLPPHELAAHIVDIHHGFLRRELPRLHAMADRVARVHGEHTPSLIEVFKVYSDLSDELNSHMMKEENVLFPIATTLGQGGTPPLALDGPISCMVHEHDEVGHALRRLRELTNHYQAPPGACNTYRAFFAGLQDLEEDLHCHIHLENHVLFPAIEKLAGKAAMQTS